MCTQGQGGPTVSVWITSTSIVLFCIPGFFLASKCGPTDHYDRFHKKSLPFRKQSITHNENANESMIYFYIHINKIQWSLTSINCLIIKSCLDSFQDLETDKGSRSPHPLVRRLLDVLKGPWTTSTEHVTKVSVELAHKSSNPS